MATLDGPVIPVHRRLYATANKKGDMASTLPQNRGIYRTNVRKLELIEEVGALRQQLALAKETEAVWEDSVSCSRRDVNRQQESLAQLRQSVFRSFSIDVFICNVPHVSNSLCRSTSCSAAYISGLTCKSSSSK
jgi:hypothetical protein